MRNLASIQKIVSVKNHPNADRLDVVQILGWNVITLRDEFKEGDLCVYCEIDSILPEQEEFEFLRPKKFRIKTVRLRGVLSQGIAFPLSVLPDGYFPLGTDVTEVLGVQKWEVEDSIAMNGLAKGSFPSWISKTDETRIQSICAVLDELRGKPYYVSQKIDGTSATYFFHPEYGFGVCSRKLELKDGDNIYWEMARKYELPALLEEMVERIGKYICVQGEIAGPGIQGNKMGLKEHKLFLFNAYDIKEGRYLDFDSFMYICALLHGIHVPLLDMGDEFPYTLEQLLEMADNGKYEPSGKQQEGIVVRPQIEMRSDRLHGSRLSFKVISNKFLLKNDQ